MIKALRTVTYERLCKIQNSFSKAHDDSAPIRTSEQSRKINDVRSTIIECMAKYTEVKCLIPLFDNDKGCSRHFGYEIFSLFSETVWTTLVLIIFGINKIWTEFISLIF